MNVVHLILIAITLNSHTGEEIHREQVKDTPVYDSIDACSADQQRQGIGRPVEGRVTVFVCEQLRGDEDI